MDKNAGKKYTSYNTVYQRRSVGTSLGLRHIFSSLGLEKTSDMPKR